MKLDHAWIAAHIPHHGSMCLLDEIEVWNEAEIICRADSHRRLDNPLRNGGRLGIVNGIEYCAQAMALHSALLASGDHAARVGYLTSVRDVQWQRMRLDDIADDLTVRAERIFGNEANILYSFSIHAVGAALLSGRASVMINAENP